MKYFYLISLILCFLSCSNQVKKEFKEGLLCKCIVFPTGTFCDTYQINVYEDGTICTYYGLRNEDFDSLARCRKVIKEHVFEKMETKKTDKLKNISVEQLRRSLLKINAKRCFHSDAMNWKDSWCILIETSSSIYLHEYGSFDDEELKNIYELLKNDSPIPLYIHGWS